MLVAPEILIYWIDAYYYSRDYNGFYHGIFLRVIDLRYNEENGSIAYKPSGFFDGIMVIDGKYSRDYVAG